MPDIFTKIVHPVRIRDLDFNTIITGDVLTVAPTLDPGSAQIVIADPPYNIGKDFGNKSDKQPMGEYLKWCDKDRRVSLS